MSTLLAVFLGRKTASKSLPPSLEVSGLAIRLRSVGGTPTGATRTEKSVAAGCEGKLSFGFRVLSFGFAQQGMENISFTTSLNLSFSRHPMKTMPGGRSQLKSSKLKVENAA
jgi:phage head maturation protease